MQPHLIFRILGTLVYGFVGWELGRALTGAIQLTTENALLIVPLTILGGLLGYFFAPWIIIAPARSARNTLRQIPISDLMAGTAGLAIGLLIATLLAYPISRLPSPFGTVLPFVGVIIFGYLGMTATVIRKNDIFILLQLDKKTGQSEAAPTQILPTLLLDTSVIIDGRIADVAETGFLLGKLVAPRFVLNELQYIADSSDVLRRNRGRRGLEILDRLQQNPEIDISFIDRDPRDVQQVDDKLISLAMELGKAAVITNDYNLNRVARLQGVKVLNINELANAVKSVYLPGEAIPLKIIQEGKETGQGVGYLEDGTMVVVENGRRYLNQEVPVNVTKVLQTNAGRLIFALVEER